MHPCFGMHVPFGQQTLTSWATKNSTIPQDWKGMAKAGLQPASRIQCFSWWREEEKDIACENRARGRETSKDQLLGEGCFTEIEVQAVYDEETLALCLLAGLNVWDKVTESGKRHEPFPQGM